MDRSPTAAVITIEPECGECDTGANRECPGHHDRTWVNVFDPRCRGGEPLRELLILSVVLTAVEVAIYISFA
jgi:hypothetical protein